MGVSGDFGGGGGGGDGGGGGGYSAPAYEAPAYSAPAYEAPAYSYSPPADNYFGGYDAYTPSYYPTETQTLEQFVNNPTPIDYSAYEALAYEAPAYEAPAYEAPAYSPPAAEPSTIKHTVERGETLSGIAANAGISLQELKDLNPKFDSDPKYDGGNTIFSGTNVNLPNSNYQPAYETPTVPSPQRSDAAYDERIGFDRNTNEYIVEPPAAEPQGTIIYEPVSTYVPPVYVAPTPPAPTIEPILTSPPPPAIKTAQPDIILFEDDLPSSQAMIDLVLEDIGGQELINIARNDTINGQNITYQPIKNLFTVQKQNNSNNIINLQQTSKQTFSNFTIDLNDKVPDSDSYLGFNTNDDNFYINVKGELVIQFINLLPDERIQVELFQTDYVIDNV